MRRRRSGGGWAAILYTMRMARRVGFRRLWYALRSRNACKTCALGMGGQQGGMVNESGHFPEVCKKSLQAMAADMQGAIRTDFWSTYSVPQLQSFSPRELEFCGRITQPVILEPGQQYYRPIPWDEALRRIAGQLKQFRSDETFWYFSGRSSNEAGFLLQLFARVYGTNNVNNCSYYCHQASGVGLGGVLGSGVGTIQLEDLDHCDLYVLIGGNPASNHPRLMTTLKNLRRRGGQVIVVNPVIETGLVNFKVPSDPWSMLFGSEIANQYVQLHIGGDLALLYAVMKRMLELGAVDEQYLASYCDGWPALKERLQQLDWSELLAKSGASRADIDEMAERYARAKNVVFGWTMGITHHTNGVENVEAVASLALMRGMVGRPHAGLMPIRGHSNVQGIGSVGVAPKLKDAIFQRLQSHFNIQLPTSTGMDTMACMEAAQANRVRFAMCLGGNLFGSNPDATYARDSMSKIDTVVYLNTTLNTGHAHGLGKTTIILPVLARDEEPQPTTQESMFSYVRLSDGGPARHEGPRSEIEVIASLARGVLGDDGPIDWRTMEDTHQIREAIAKIIPGWEQIATIDRTKQEFQIAGRTFHEPKFPTANGRAQISVHSIPELAGGEDELRLMTVRSEGQFNTVVYEDYDLYRSVERRDVILMHPDDMRRRGLQNDQRVTVTSQAGEMPNILARAWPKIKAGNVLMYYPEANVLVPRALDPRSKTPAFKAVLVTVAPMAPATMMPQRIAQPVTVQ
ncbi:MAG: FdhF/YdeP family oxidoreductase [Planctomycetes bacterium]|nr:FdhF/YdeP family oxidoreductase [Planctomycetota bacterium]